MPGNPKLQRNGSSTDRVEEVMRRLKVDDNDENGRVGDGYPDRPGEPDCIYYLRTGSCGYGSNCRYNHPSHAEQVDGVKNTIELPERPGQPDCEHYLKTGTCKYGSVCKYHHPKDKLPEEAVMNSVGLPMRQDAQPCSYYMRTGSCKYGSACKFHHPQPLLGGNVLPVYGSGGSTPVFSSGAPFSKETYFGSSLPLPQSYMPFYMSPSQGFNTYMGGVSPLPVASVLTVPSTNGHPSASYLPERPDQPECRYFMNYGSCKYGPVCKYHHPREKLSQLTQGSIVPLALPLRPGQPACSDYTLYGLCKYGPTCRFDHPPYSFGVPPRMLLAPLPLPLPNPKPSKLTNWVRKGPTATNHKNQFANAKAIGDSSDPLPELQSEPSSEAICNVSD